MMRRFVLLATFLAFAGGVAPAVAADVEHFSSEFSYTSFYACGNGGIGELVEWTSVQEVVHLYHDTDQVTVFNVVVRERATGIGQTTGDQYRLVLTGQGDPYKYSHGSGQGFFLSNTTLLVWDEDGLLTNQRWMILGVTNANGVETASHVLQGAGCR